MNINLADQLSTPVQLPEYGRNVQKMVAFLKTIESREQRNEQAAVVVSIMANLSPHRRDTEEFRHMLWDHLFVIANFDLDIDAPYQMPDPEEFNPIPKPIKYSPKKIFQKQYGKFAKEMLKNTAANFQQTEENQQDVDSIALNLAKFLKQKSFEYNGSHPDGKQIVQYVKKLTNDIPNLEDDAIDNIALVAKPQQQQKQQQKQQQHKKNNSNKK